MLIGILADTHDNLEKVDAAVRSLNAKGVEMVLHAGDYVSPFVIPRFANLQSPMIGVLGNNDGDHRLLQRRFEAQTPHILGNIFSSSLSAIFRTCFGTSVIALSSPLLTAYTFESFRRRPCGER